MVEMLMHRRIFLKNQSGLVSITVAIIMMTIISLIVVSFSLVSRREQRLALDRRLSSQAYFAAESGVNKAKYEINNNNVTNNIESCSSSLAPIDLGDGVKTTCVLVDKTPDSISFDSVVAKKAKVTKLTSANDSSIKRLEFFWESKDMPNSYATSLGVFPPSADYSVLKVSLTQLPSSFDRNTIAAQTYTAYLYPLAVASLTDTSSTLSFTTTNQGSILQGQCINTNTPKKCRARIDIPASISTSNFYLVLSSIYSDASVDIRAYDSSLSRLRFSGSQAIIDSTGIAGDVLRRVQARVPLSDSWMVDNFAVSSQEVICKLYKHNAAEGALSEHDKSCPRTETFQ